MRLPVVEHPERYVGLYVFDFGTHVSIGYTAGEIELLRQAAAHREGTAYEIYRIDDSGRYELRGACDERLAAQEALCFLHADLTAARSDYDRLTAHAAQRPVPCAAEVILARIAAFDPPGVAAVTYPAAAAACMSAWLRDVSISPGTQVVGGADAWYTLNGARAEWTASETLAGVLDYRDRCSEEVLASTDRSVQR